jgi:hypothetical protein
MNPAPTKAKVTDQDAAFAMGARKSVNGATSGTGAGNTPATIADRKDTDGFNGSNLQPIRKGTRYKFIDAPENHPRIPKSSQKEFTQETEAIPTAQSGNTAQIPGIQNKSI